ncbi:MAG: prenyltransferase/squalene oxidase repeat-containing protein [Candidatus Bilamarchaeaceae archaeon]
MMNLNEYVDIKELLDFVKCRLNSDGGYSFSYPMYGVEFPSSVSETFYAIAILSLLGEYIPSKKKTIRYLKEIQRPDGSYDSVNVAFYAIKTLKILGERTEISDYYAQFLHSKLNRSHIDIETLNDEFLTADYDTTDSPFKTAYQIAEILHTCKDKIKKEDFSWLNKQNNEWMFIQGHLDIVSTYHVLNTLKLAGYDVSSFRQSVEFVLRCEVKEGGYAIAPEILPPYIETTHFAVEILKMFKKAIKKRKNHINFIAHLQNEDGGFRRAKHIGISTLGNSYFAIKSLLELMGDEYED